MLVYACSCTPKQAADIVKVKRSEAVSAVSWVLSSLSGKSSAVKEKELKKICNGELKRFPYAPEMTAFNRALENRLLREESKKEMSSGGKALFSNAMAVIMLLLIGFIIWIGMVMLNYFRESSLNREPTQTLISEKEDASVQGTD